MDKTTDNERKWVLTDEDCFRVCRKLDNNLYEFYQIIDYDPNKDEVNYGVAHNVIDIRYVDIENICDRYSYESLDQIKKIHGDTWKRFFAEYAFELSCMASDICGKGLTYKEATDLICRLSGYGETADNAPEPKTEGTGYIALMVSGSYAWAGYGATEKEAKEAILYEWRQFFDDEEITLKDLEDDYKFQVSWASAANIDI